MKVGCYIEEISESMLLFQHREKPPKITPQVFAYFRRINMKHKLDNKKVKFQKLCQGFESIQLIMKI